MRGLPAGSAHTCVTSPPYFGLRDYGHEGQIGLEETPDAFVAKLVEVFREVRRVLREDGTLWLNLGDSYAGTGKSGGGAQGERWASAGADTTGPRGGKWAPPPQGLKRKDRMMIPARTALALQADGWWLRDEIVWHKPRPTPHPVKDRTVSAHEMIYLFAKSPVYYYDYLAIEEPSAYPGLKRKAGKAFRDLADADPNAARKRPGVDREIVVRETRRKRSVWSVSPSPYKDGHFATFPPDLIEPCILAGAPKGGTVLDPFGGSGTTAGVAVKHGRRAILCELNPEYAALIPARVASIAGDTPDMFMEAAE
jgi:site-specific DNA-methyltransferase (adenine-specific)